MLYVIRNRATGKRLARDYYTHERAESERLALDNPGAYEVGTEEVVWGVNMY